MQQGLAGLPLKHRRKDAPKGARLYHGPMEIPPHVAEIVRESPDVHKLRGGKKFAMRYADGATTWLFRCRVPESRQMVGDIMRQPDGRIRICCWSAATPSPTIPTVDRLLERHAQIEPALPEPEVDISRYLDPAYSQQLLDEPPLPLRSPEA